MVKDFGSENMICMWQKFKSFLLFKGQIILRSYLVNSNTLILYYQSAMDFVCGVKNSNINI